MPIFKINTEQSMGFTHYGEVMIEGSGEVKLTDEEVRQLIELIRDNNGETDIEELELEEKYPDLYEKLNGAYRDVAVDALWRYLVIDGFENGYYEEPDDAIETAEQNYGFKFEYDENDFIPDGETEMDEDEFNEERNEAFYEWVDEYRKNLDEADEAMFLDEVFDIAPELDNYDYEIEIPEEIIKMAKKEKA
jgi:hypothetical protein